jgi:hypothetical protein
MKYVFMVRDELGDKRRAEETEFLAAVHEFPEYEENDDAMAMAFYTWKQAMTERGQREWEEIYGSESRVFLERLWSDYYKNMMVRLF